MKGDDMGTAAALSSRKEPESMGFHLRKPGLEDGHAIWALVKETGVLDVNSAYLYLLLTRDFAETCVVAEYEGSLLGFVTGFIRPTSPDCLFIWQVGVNAESRGAGLAGRMLVHLLRRGTARNIRFLETTVTASNRASIRLFDKLAESLGTEICRDEGFGAELFPGDGHEAEDLYRIGPFNIFRQSPERTQEKELF